MYIFFEYEHLKRLVSIDDNIFAYQRKIGNLAHFPNWQYRYTIAEFKRIRQPQIFFR